MFGLFKKKNPYDQIASELYQQLAEQAREPVFYRFYGVPDNIDGRFDLLLLHMFLVLHRLVGRKEAKDLSQSLFDMTFAAMDQALREAGIGDMGVPKHMRRMMKAFNGRMHAYEDAVAKDQLEEALSRNLYGSVSAPSGPALRQIADYVYANIDFIEAQSLETIMGGRIEFLPPEEEEIKQYG